MYAKVCLESAKQFSETQVPLKRASANEFIDGTRHYERYNRLKMAKSYVNVTHVPNSFLRQRITKTFDDLHCYIVQYPKIPDAHFVRAQTRFASLLVPRAVSQCDT